MPNQNFTEHAERKLGGSAVTKHADRAASATVKEGTAAWPGLPGKSQSRDRSAGVKRVKTSPKSEGL